MRKFLWLIPLWALFSCSGKHYVKISGTVDDAVFNSYIYLYNQRGSEPKLIDSARIGRKGSFSLRIRVNEQGFYNLGMFETKMVTLLLAPGEKVNFETRQGSFASTYKVTGSSGSDLIHELIDQNQSVQLHLDSLVSDYLRLKSANGSAKELAAVDSNYKSCVEAYRKSIISFVLEHHHSLSSIMALYMKYDSSSLALEIPRDLQFYKIVTDTLSRYFPRSPQVIALKADFKRMMDSRRSMQLLSLVKTAREGLPDISLPDVHGDTIHLASFTNKVLLLSFWNSDCKKCLMQNNDFMELYRKYAKAGLVIYQVSVAESKENWKKAVASLPWISVAEGNPGASYYCQLYNVSQVPAFFLVDRKGTILGKNLDYAQLNKEIASAIKK